jgi:hypothetical protein
VAVRSRRAVDRRRLCAGALSLVAIWTTNEVSDTDRFVATAGPLIDDPAVQGALTNRVTATVFQYVDVQGLADQSTAAPRSKSCHAPGSNDQPGTHPPPR